MPTRWSLLPTLRAMCCAPSISRLPLWIVIIVTALNYVAHNIVAGVPFISKVGTQAKNGKEALWGGLLGGILLGLCALALNFGMLTTYDQVYMLEVPGLEFAKMLNLSWVQFMRLFSSS